ncbi:NAD(P)-binding protein [Echria macrotheca]|uniref:NAD(P)-binding protein n=1 Tax=Echria macrotheca TaxID=438768 RepID=A0AAJ0F5W6_9PEZI|nr:NAD(P)-binding protein [Echria macrotheca]
MSIIKVAFFGSKNESKDFDPARDIQPLTGRVILITGAAGDLGRQTAIDLARHGRPAQIVIADLPRDAAGVEAALSAIRTALPPDTASTVRLDFLPIDLSSFASIRSAASAFLSLSSNRLDILILNAGIMPVSHGVTSDGYEKVFGVNYLGHALLTRLLLPTLQSTTSMNQDVRIVIVASEGHAMAPKGGIVFDTLKTEAKKLNHFRRYGQSKVALIAFAKELAQRYPDIKTAAIHPGRISTGLSTELVQKSWIIRLTGPISRFVVTTVELGARNQVWAATSADVVSGRYYVPVGVVDEKTVVERDQGLAGRLWEWTEGELKGVDKI